MKYTQLLVLIVAGFTYNPTICDEVITLFLQPYPVMANDSNQDSIMNTLKEPGAIDRNIVHNILDKAMVSGIFATYAGYLHISDYNGQLTFPRVQEKPIIYLLVTTRITPSVIIDNTLHHWELEDDTPAAFYKFERKQDQLTQLLYWETTKQDIPTGKALPLETIILFAKPKYIYVPTGITLTYEKPNYVLPPIYVKKGIKILSSTLYILNIRQFFGKTGTLHKQEDLDRITIIDPHPTY